MNYHRTETGTGICHLKPWITFHPELGNVAKTVAIIATTFLFILPAIIVGEYDEEFDGQ